MTDLQTSLFYQANNAYDGFDLASRKAITNLSFHVSMSLCYDRLFRWEFLRSENCARRLHTKNFHVGRNGNNGFSGHDLLTDVQGKWKWYSMHMKHSFSCQYVNDISIIFTFRGLERKCDRKINHCEGLSEHDDLLSTKCSTMDSAKTLRTRIVLSDFFFALLQHQEDLCASEHPCRLVKHPPGLSTIYSLWKYRTCKWKCCWSALCRVMTHCKNASIFHRQQ